LVEYFRHAPLTGSYVLRTKDAVVGGGCVILGRAGAAVPVGGGVAVAGVAVEVCAEASALAFALVTGAVVVAVVAVVGSAAAAASDDRLLSRARRFSYLLIVPFEGVSTEYLDVTRV